MSIRDREDLRNGNKCLLHTFLEPVTRNKSAQSHKFTTTEVFIKICLSRSSDLANDIPYLDLTLQ
jgi:hypothetical protein